MKLLNIGGGGSLLCFFLLSVWSLVLASGVSDGESTVQKVKLCFEDSSRSNMATKDPKSNKRQGLGKKRLFLNFGKKGIEGIKVLSPDDISQIEALVTCVNSVDSTFFLPSSSDDLDFNRLYGSNNVTFLNGALAKVLPDMAVKVRTILLESLKKSGWNERRKHFGLRSVYVLAADRDGLDDHLEKVRIRQEEKEAKKAMFIISPIDPNAKDKTQQIRDIENERLNSYLVERPGTLYSLVIQLTDDGTAHGGHLAVKVPENEAIDDLNEEESEFEMKDEEVAKSLHRPIEDIMLEKGSAFLIHGGNSYGFEPVHYGKKSCLVVEFWQYLDSPFNVGRPTVRHGEALGLIGDGRHSAEL